MHDVSLEDSEDDNENGNTLNETEISINDGNESSKKIKIPKVTAKDIVPGLSFSSKPVAVLALKRAFSKEFFHPIVKVSGPSEKSEDFDENGPKCGIPVCLFTPRVMFDKSLMNTYTR